MTRKLGHVPAAAFIAVVALAFSLGAWSHWRLALGRALKEVQASCHSHLWGEAKSLYDQGRPKEWYRHCARCGTQQNGETEQGPWKIL